MKTGIIEPYYIEGRGIYIPIIDKVLAMKDSYNGERVPFEKSSEAPTITEWHVIFYFKEKINELFRQHGGEELKEDRYWSSTQYDEQSAWLVYPNDGYTGYYDRYYYGFVRAVSVL